jgi:putative oxidoreductase
VQPYIASSAQIDLVAVSAGLLALRMVLGLYMMAHGVQKLLGWFGGYGLNGTSVFFEQLGFRPARAFVVIAAVTEVTSGALVAAGLFGPVGPALMLSVLIVAAVSVHWANGWFVTSNGIEHPVIFAVGALALGLSGPGVFSLDAILGFEFLWSASLAGVAIGVAVVGSVANLATRRPSPEHGAR